MMVKEKDRYGPLPGQGIAYADDGRLVEVARVGRRDGLPHDAQVRSPLFNKYL
jgi:hypothetical protein